MANKWGRTTKDIFRRIWRPSEMFFSMSFATFLFFMAVISSLLLAGVQGVQLIYFWVVSSIWLVVVLLSLIRIKMEPDKLDIIIEKLDKLLEIKGNNDTRSDKVDIENKGN